MQIRSGYSSIEDDSGSPGRNRNMRLYANGSTSSSASSSITIDPERESLLTPTDNSVVTLLESCISFKLFSLTTFPLGLPHILCVFRIPPKLVLPIKCLLKSPIQALTSWQRRRLASTIPTSTGGRKLLDLFKLFAFRYYLIE